MECSSLLLYLASCGSSEGGETLIVATHSVALAVGPFFLTMNQLCDPKSKANKATARGLALARHWSHALTIPDNTHVGQLFRQPRWSDPQRARAVGALEHLTATNFAAALWLAQLSRHRLCSYLECLA